MEFRKSQDALNWLVNHPDERLYVDEYGNYVMWSPYSNVIEYYWYTGDDEDENGDFYPGDWDFERMNAAEFINRYDNKILSTDII